MSLIWKCHRQLVLANSGSFFFLKAVLVFQILAYCLASLMLRNSTACEHRTQFFISVFPSFRFARDWRNIWITFNSFAIQKCFSSTMTWSWIESKQHAIGFEIQSLNLCAIRFQINLLAFNEFLFAIWFSSCVLFSCSVNFVESSLFWMFAFAEFPAKQSSEICLLTLKVFRILTLNIISRRANETFIE